MTKAIAEGVDVTAPEPVAPEVLVLDLDDTVYDTSRAFEFTAQLAAEAGMADMEMLNEARRAKEKTGRTFDLDAYLLDQKVPDDDISGLYEALGDNEPGIDFLYPDGRRLLTAIGHTAAAAYFLTRGVPRRQVAKLRSAGLLEFPHIITDELVKSSLINGSRGPEGEYLAETTVGVDGLRSIRSWRGVLVEDRPKGLAGLDYPDWTGLLVRRLQKDGTLRAAHQGTVPAGVMVSPSLDVITEQIYRGAEVGDMVRAHLGGEAPAA